VQFNINYTLKYVFILCIIKYNKLRLIAFLPRDAMLAQYMLSSCVCLSICLSCLTHAGIVPKRQNVRSCKQRHAIAQIFDAKHLGEISMGSPQRRRQIEVGQVKSGDFRLISRYISEMVQDKDIVTMEG